MVANQHEEKTASAKMYHVTSGTLLGYKAKCHKYYDAIKAVTASFSGVD